MSTTACAFGQFGESSLIDSPNAPTQYAPNREFHLMNVKVQIDVDYPTRKITGVATNTVFILRDGTREITLSARSPIKILGVSVDGKPAPYTREGRMLKITCGPSLRGRVLDATIHYVCENASGGTIVEGGGWHWIVPRPDGPGGKDHVGFWTQGETSFNSAWLPTWDYPNDMTSSETITTVPADWTVISNGVLVSDKLSPDKKRRTFDWKLTDPHATYLISLVGGPFDVKVTSWRGVTLRYVVPKGEGARIDDSFGDTPDMLSFYSDSLGVKYAWPQYAQSAMYDFGGGMENVSATTLQENALTDKRESYRGMEPLTAHELAHQWFGDLVTCHEWGDTWLNEGFATYFEIMYTQHSRGENAFQREMDQNIEGYVRGARRSQHALSTRRYNDPEAMFDGHSYNKGAAVLHTMRSFLGDKLFFGGLGHYLNKFRHQPVSSDMLCQAMTEWTGIDMEPFFDQWVFKPGHPIIRFSWRWDDSAHQVVATVKQVQPTNNGTPIYDYPAPIGLIVNGKVERRIVHMSKSEEDFSLPSASKPDAVLFDPDHSFLKEISDRAWAKSEWLPILKYAPSCLDRNAVANLLMAGDPSYDVVQTVAKEIASDSALFPAFTSIGYVTRLKPEDERPVLRQILSHASFNHRAQAAQYLGDFPPDASDAKTLGGLINDTSPYSVVRSALKTLLKWDPKGNADLLVKAVKDPGLRRNEGIIGLIVGDSTDSNPRELRLAAVTAMGELGTAEPESSSMLGEILTEDDWGLVAQAVEAIAKRKEKDLLDDLKRLDKRQIPSDLKASVERTVKELGG
jgi:aminopeptidase N